MPAGCIDCNVDVVFPPGSYLDVELLSAEIETLRFPKEKIFVSPYAKIVTAQHKEWERKAGLKDAIGSTGSGVGAAVLAMTAREGRGIGLPTLFAEDCGPLQNFLADTSALLRRKLNVGDRIVIEGTQGFGLSLIDGGYWPKATARQTTAAGAVAEAGLSPIDVDDITMVLRAFPIRVSGDSGPLPNELTWEEIAQSAGKNDLREYTTVTKRLRRVGRFDSELVLRAIDANNPTRIVMNHLDYLGNDSEIGLRGSNVHQFIEDVEIKIGRKLDWLGFSPFGIREKESHS
tara:strand:- start:36224 stop:37090 length:867 start_codon:yes stop_codon:yes gene_type:complete